MHKLRISQKLKNLLGSMRENKIATRILEGENLEADRYHNFLDISDTNDIITFIPESKIDEVIKFKSTIFEVSNNERYLKRFSKANTKIFAELGYDPNSDDSDDEDFAPEVGTIGRVLKEAIGEVSGNTYCLFEYNGRLIVYNKLALTPHNNSELEFKSKNRNSIKIGRYVNSFFRDQYTSKEIESFVNEFKASHAILKDEFSKFRIVEGEDIRYWYNGDRYLMGGGSLNKSCMAKSNGEFFNIYVDNPIKMVILHTDDGYLEDGKYLASKIRGRALLWEDVTMGDKKITFLDRVYTTHDSDVELFKQLAIKNGWFYKKTQSMETYDTLTNGVSEVNRPFIYKVVNKVDYGRYPFMDTLCNISLDGKIMSNMSDLPKSHDRRLRATGGGWE